MTIWIQGRDASFAELTPEKANLLKAAGVLVWEQCLWDGTQQPEHRVTNLRIASEAGLYLLGYISPIHSSGGARAVAAGRAGIPNDLWAAMVKVPIDIEEAEIGITFKDVLDALAAIKSISKPQDIYTNLNTWKYTLGDPTRPVGVGLQDASWGSSTPYPNGYGGWMPNEVWGWQYRGGTVENGIDVDFDLFDAAIFGPVPPTPEPTPDPSPVAKTHQVDVFSDGSIKVS